MTKALIIYSAYKHFHVLSLSLCARRDSYHFNQSKSLNPSVWNCWRKCRLCFCGRTRQWKHRPYRCVLFSRVFRSEITFLVRRLVILTIRNLRSRWSKVISEADLVHRIWRPFPFFQIETANGQNTLND